MSEIDTTNKHMVSSLNGDIVIMRPPTRMSPDEAMVYAAWIVAMASMGSSHPFKTYYDKVCNT